MSIEMPAALTELPDWLAAREAAAGSIRADAEKIIRFASPRQPAVTEVSVLYLHGHSATRQELYPLPEQLAGALGANLHCTRLPSHGLLDKPLYGLTLENLKATGLEAAAVAARLGHRRVVIAASTGATLATWLAANGALASDDILLFLSPNFGTRRLAGELLTYPLLRQLIRWKHDQLFGFEPRNFRHGQYWTTHYPVRALFPMLDLVREVRRLPLEHLQNPLLVLYSPRDQVVSVSRLLQQTGRFGGNKQLITIDNSQDASSHTLAGDILSPQTTTAVLEHCLDFVSRNLTAVPD